MRLYIVFSGSLLFAADLLAQTREVQFNVVYECPAIQARAKIYSCAGNAKTDPCDVETFPRGKPSMRGKSSRQQVEALVAICHLQTPGEAKGEASGAPPASAPGAGGFKMGDEIQILTAGGWMNAKVLQVRGGSYFVHAANGADVWKSYPGEVRRIGKLTMQDHLAGQYDLHDRVQVLYQGKWTEGELTGYNYGANQFDVHVQGGTVTTTLQNIRPSTTAPPAPRSEGQAPKPGLTACNGKFDGRWEPSNGMGGMRIVFRGAKARVSEMLSPEREYECWMDGGKIALYAAGTSKPYEVIEINNDGTLQTTLVELKRKGN
jgi:hypothetical protein